MPDQFCSLLIELDYLTIWEAPFFFFFKGVDEGVVVSLVKLLPVEMLGLTVAFDSKRLEKISLCG